MDIIDPNEKDFDQEIFDCIDWSTESNYTGYDEEDDDDAFDDDFDLLMTDVNMGLD